MVRVMAIQNEGHDVLSIVRRIAAGPLTLLSNNHCLPLIKEFTLDDIVFGIFPRTGGCFDDAWSAWAKNSVGDILDMILQILEVINLLPPSKGRTDEVQRDTGCGLPPRTEYRASGGKFLTLNMMWPLTSHIGSL